MKKAFIVIVICVVVVLVLNSCEKQPESQSVSDQNTTLTPAISKPEEPKIAQVGGIIKIVTPDDRARLCPNFHTGEGEELLRIPTNTELKVVALNKDGVPSRYIIWYKVTYGGKTGWISEFDTDLAPEKPRGY